MEQKLKCNFKPRVFISGPITGIHYGNDLKGPKKMLKRLQSLKDFVESYGFKCYLPHEHTGRDVAPSLSADEVFEINLREIKKSCLVIADVSEPSTGVGVEIMLAKLAKIPEVLICEKDSRPSKMALGSCSKVFDYRIDGPNKGEIYFGNQFASQLERHLKLIAIRNDWL